jgi:hypothetical protein
VGSAFNFHLLGVEEDLAAAFDEDALWNNVTEAELFFFFFAWKGGGWFY